MLNSFSLGQLSALSAVFKQIEANAGFEVVMLGKHS
jgi:hypothetical protein